MRRKILVLTTMVLSCFILLTGCGSNDKQASNGAQDQGTQKETFTIAMEAGYPPFNWTQMSDSNGGVKIQDAAEYAGGYDIEIAKRLAESLGKELKVIKVEWDGLVPALISGKADAIIAGMSPTAERKESIDFSDVYYKSDLVMVVKSGGAYENASKLGDFAGSKITAQLNTFHYSVIDQIEGVLKQTAMDNFPAMRVALESGMIDGYVSERPEAISASNANPNLVMVEFTDGFQTSIDDTAIAVGIKKDSELTEKVNEILSTISEEERVEIMNEAIKNQPASN